jgi:hypothetical protein
MASETVTLYLGGWTPESIKADQCARRIADRANEYRKWMGVNLTTLQHVIRQEVEKTIKEASDGKET